MAHPNLSERSGAFIHSDNAGEFTSRSFEEFLDSASITQTTSPPHIHQLNGVAERTIRSAMSLARTYVRSSEVPVTHWTSAVTISLDELNRTSGPTADGSSLTSYEILTGNKPRVFGILPFGCRAFAVKLPAQVNKRTIDPRSWVGVNLGLSAKSPGAYDIWVPSSGRIVTTSVVLTSLNTTSPAVSAAVGTTRITQVCPRRPQLALRTAPQSRISPTLAALQICQSDQHHSCVTQNSPRSRELSSYFRVRTPDLMD